MKTDDKSSKNMLIFAPICRIGEEVYHITDKSFEVPMIATNFNINHVADGDEVTGYTVGCSFADGRLSYFQHYELKVKEGVEA